MRPYGFTGNGEPGFQRHHLIPVNLIRSRPFEHLFLSVTSVGFDARNFLSNGLSLPATEDVVEQTGLPLHRGPHPLYDQLVAECLGEISSQGIQGENKTPVSAYRRISELQGVLRRALQHDASLMLNRNDPRGSACPLFKLDHDILQLSLQDLLA
jgi:A nuclease family of the HNH/ENDO VII superfamily with conserved AHH